MEYSDVTGQQKGALGESLFDVDNGPLAVFRAWAYDDLHQHEDFTPATPQDISISRCGTHNRSECPFFHCDPFPDRPGWFPDIHYYIRQRDLKIDYLIEVKTGSSATISETQRDVMEHLESTDDYAIPVRARVDASKLPEEYGVRFTRIHDRWPTK